MKKYDAMIVLGGGTKNDKDLSMHSEARMIKAIEFYKENKAEVLIVSGGQSFWIDNNTDKISDLTEAELMFKYAIKQGVPSKCIRKEVKSKDTISNALYTKEIVRKESFTSLLVITSKLYVDRCNYIFGKVFGSKYEVIIDYVDPKPYTVDDITREKEVLRLTKNYLDEIRDGNEKQIKAILSKFHPAFGGYSREVNKLNRFK